MIVNAFQCVTCNFYLKYKCAFFKYYNTRKYGETSVISSIIHNNINCMNMTKEN